MRSVRHETILAWDSIYSTLEGFGVISQQRQTYFCCLILSSALHPCLEFCVHICANTHFWVAKRVSNISIRRLTLSLIFFISCRQPQEPAALPVPIPFPSHSSAPSLYIVLYFFNSTKHCFGFPNNSLSNFLVSFGVLLQLPPSVIKKIVLIFAFPNQLESASNSPRRRNGSVPIMSSVLSQTDLGWGTCKVLSLNAFLQKPVSFCSPSRTLNVIALDKSSFAHLSKQTLPLHFLPQKPVSFNYSLFLHSLPLLIDDRLLEDQAVVFVIRVYPQSLMQCLVFSTYLICELIRALRLSAQRLCTLKLASICWTHPASSSCFGCLFSPFPLLSLSSYNAPLLVLPLSSDDLLLFKG